MTGTDLLALLPFWILAAAALLIMVSISVKRNFRFVAVFSLIASAAAFVSIFWASRFAPRTITALFIVDSFGLFFIGVLIAAGFFIFLLSSCYFNDFPDDREEFFLLIFLALLGAAVLVSSRHFASFFLGLEILSVSLYALTSYPTGRKESIEAGLKYLVLASTSAAFLLFGMALIYAEAGSLDFSEMSARLAVSDWSSPVVLLGISLMIVGLGFKLAVVPFHMWTPDVYQGAPAPVTALVAAVSKGGIFVFLVRFFIILNVHRYPALVLVFGLISAGSMFAGNFLALQQKNIKRILAYSSIAHLGYLLVAFLAGGRIGVEAASFYLVAYFMAIIAAFGVVAFLSSADKEAESLEEYRGLFWNRPWLAAILTGALLSLAGIPLTAGFLGKFYVAAAGVESSLWVLVVILIINSTIGLYYYLRIIVTMIRPPEAAETKRQARVVSFAGFWTGGFALLVLFLLIIMSGVFPAVVIQVIKTAVGSLDYPSISTMLGGGW